MTLEITSTSRSAPALIWSGVGVAPLFFGLSALQLPFRPDYDITALPLSYLALGEAGWVQSGNFVLTGLLALACAIGFVRIRIGIVIPVLVGLYGLGMIAAGVFPPDQPALAKVGMSASGAIHMMAFLASFVSLVAAALLFAYDFTRSRRWIWASLCAGAALAAPLLVALSMAQPLVAGLFVVASGLVLFGWLSLIALHLARSGSAILSGSRSGTRS